MRHTGCTVTNPMRRQRGVTLIELMIVVAIIGILAAVAVYMFRRSTQRAKSSEVPAMFTEFKLRQEQYHVENSTYLSTGADETDYWPPTPAGPDTPQLLQPARAEWITLKMAPNATSAYCAYVAISGAGGDATNIGAVATGFGLAGAPASNWYYLIAECDFDGQATNSFYFARSDVDGMQVQNEGR